jgi:hypothetical protein
VSGIGTSASGASNTDGDGSHVARCGDLPDRGSGDAFNENDSSASSPGSYIVEFIVTGEGLDVPFGRRFRIINPEGTDDPIPEELLLLK